MRGLIAGLFVLGFAVLVSTASFADGDHKVDLTKIKSAATALQATHTDLATGLTKYVDEEAKEELEKKDAKGEKEGEAEEKDEMAKKEHHAAMLKLFRDSAAALQTTNPDLTDELTKIADRKQKWMEKKHKEGKEDSENDEANEMKDKK